MLEPQLVSTIPQVAALHQCSDGIITHFFYPKPTNICSVQNRHPCCSESGSRLNGNCSLKALRVYPENVSQTAVTKFLLTLIDFPVSLSDFFFLRFCIYLVNSPLSHLVPPNTVLNRRHTSQREPSSHP